MKVSANVPAASETSPSRPIRLNAPWWGRISLLWLMFAPLCVAIYALCLSISPNDFWYHARAGSITATTGHIPTTNLFSTGVPLDKPYYNQGWIAHWVFYKILERGGLAWIAIFRSACMALAYALIALAAMRRARRVAMERLSGQETPAQLLELENGVARTAALAALLTFGMSALNMDVRPQTFSFPLFALFAFVIYEWPFAASLRPFYIALLAVAMALWSNTHGAFFTALVVIGTVLAAEIYHFWRPVRLFGERLPAFALRQLGVLAALCGVAAMLNPHGAGIFVYVVGLAKNVIGEQFIQEWKPPRFEIQEWSSIIFFVSPLLVTWLLWRKGKAANQQAWNIAGMRAGECLALAALFVMGLRNVRSLVWYALFFAPAFAGVFTAFRLKAGVWWQSAAPEPPRAVYAMNAVMALLLLGLIVPALPWIKPELPLPPAFRARFAPTPRGAFPSGFSGDPPLLLDNTTPVEAAEFLRKNPPHGRLYNEMVFGSYLMWALYPQTLPNADPRIELYPDQYWFDYLKFQDNPRDAGRILAGQGYSDALLNPKLQKPLVNELSRTPGWKKYVFKSGPAILFRHEPGQ